MPIVPAKCPQCGGDIEVDNKKDAAICKFCGSAFIIEKAINNYNKNITITGGEIHIHNDSINNSDYQKIIALLDRNASTYCDETKEDELLKKYYDRYYENNFDDIKVNEIQCIDAMNSIKRSIEADDDGEVDTLQFCLSEANNILKNLKEIKNTNIDLYNKLYLDFKNIINEYLYDSMGISFTGGSLMVKMLYSDLFMKFYGEYISAIFTNTNNNEMSFEYYFDDDNDAIESEDGEMQYWENNSGFLEDNEEYDNYCNIIDEYITNDPFEDEDKKYMSFIKTIYDVVVKKLSREQDKHINYMKRHFSLIKNNDFDGKVEAYRYIFFYLWDKYKRYYKENDYKFYYELKLFYILTKNPYLKQILDSDFKISLFGNIKLIRNEEVNVNEMIEQSLSVQKEIN